MPKSPKYYKSLIYNLRTFEFTAARSHSSFYLQISGLNKGTKAKKNKASSFSPKTLCSSEETRKDNFFLLEL